MEYVRVIDQSELPANTMRAVSVGGKEVLLANVDGAYYAVANQCTHAGGSLGKGALEGSVVTCPKHGAQFDLKTGKSIREAKVGFMKMKAKDEEIFTVKVEGSSILIGIPE